MEPGADKNTKLVAIYLAKAQALCASREYCVSDIATRLESWGLTDKDAIEKIISSLLRDKFIDEHRYAAAFSRDKLRYNKWGRIKIEWQLKMKGLNSNCIKESMAGIDEAEYKDIAEKLIVGMIKTRKGDDRNILRAKILRSMQSKGFEYAVTGEIVKRLL